MAYHHHPHHLHHHQTTTAATCCSSCTCHSPPFNHPPPPPPHPPSLQPHHSTDPFLIATIVSQLLQTQPSQTHTIKPISTNPFHHQQQQQSHFLDSSPPFLSTLLQRIDALESSLNNLSLNHHHPSSSSSSSSCSLHFRNAAARVIQTHFRAFLARRSRALRQLKHLANVKSTLACLKTSFSPHGFLDFDALSHQAMDLLLFLDSIQGEDQMVRDGKKSITREIVRFLELVDGVCVKRHQVLTRKVKSLRLGRNESSGAAHGSKRYVEGSRGSKCRNADNEEKKLIANLRERVERIGRISRALDAEEVGDDVLEGFEHGDGDSDIIDEIAGNYVVKNGGVGVNKNVLRSNGKKRVCFVEDGNVIRVYNVDGDMISAARDVEEIEDSLKGTQDEEEAQSDGDRSSQSSGGIRNQRSYEVAGNHDHESRSLLQTLKLTSQQGSLV